MGAMVSQITSFTTVFSTVHLSRWTKTSKLCVTGLCTGNSPVTGEFPAQRASNAENVSIWWRHHEIYFVKMNLGARYVSFLMNCECKHKRLLHGILVKSTVAAIASCINYTLDSVRNLISQPTASQPLLPGEHAVFQFKHTNFPRLSKLVDDVQRIYLAARIEYRHYTSKYLNDAFHSPIEMWRFQCVTVMVTTCSLGNLGKFYCELVNLIFINSVFPGITAYMGLCNICFIRIPAGLKAKSLGHTQVV